MLVYGAGAVGSYLGGSLARQGHPVTFLERPHNAPTLKKQGLQLKLEDREHHLTDFGVAASLSEALEQGRYDVALFALKSYDTDNALEEIGPHASDMPPLVCLQNGVDNEAALAAVLGSAKVIAATVTTAVAKRGPGEIQLERKRGVGLAGNHPLSERLLAAMDQADLNPRLYANPKEMKWSKLLTNLLANATCAILDMSPAEVFEDKQLFRLEMLQLREALAVMSAQDLYPVDLPGTPVRALAFAARGLNFALARPLMARAVGRGRGGKMPSLHIDLHSGKGRSEVAWLNGAVARYGSDLDVDTPVNTAIYQTLSSLVAGDLDLSEYREQPHKLLSRVG